MHKPLFFVLLILTGTALAAVAAVAGSSNVPGGGNKTVDNNCPPANWTALDLDQDGYATKDEVKKAAPCLDFDAIDTNGDDSVSRVEYLDFQEAKATGQARDGTANDATESTSGNSAKAADSDCPPDEWTALDLDQDGYATKDEVKKAAPCIDFDAIDSNGDDSVSRVEYLDFQEAKATGQARDGTANDATDNTAGNSVKAADDECPPDEWTALDSDQDGYATKDEVKKAAPCIKFDAVDSNGDGSISRVEFLSFQEAKARGTSAGKSQGASDESTATQNQAQDEGEQESARQQGRASGEKIDQGQYDTPKALVANVPQGELKNPFKPDNKAIAKEGHQLFQNRGCSGCHGGGGGGGMGPPLTDQTWSYGDKPDTLYRLVTLGSKQLQEKYGYNRNIMQTMQADMPGLGESFDNTEDLWKIITWVESKHSKN